jgi:hypothetical protein
MTGPQEWNFEKIKGCRAFFIQTFREYLPSLRMGGRMKIRNTFYTVNLTQYEPPSRKCLGQLPLLY